MRVGLSVVVTFPNGSTKPGVVVDPGGGQVLVEYERIDGVKIQAWFRRRLVEAVTDGDV